MTLRPTALAALLLGATSGGCATLTGVLALAGASPATSSHETVTPLGARERRTEVTTELAPLRVRCVLHERAARERVRVDTHGIDTVGRITYGFVGLGEAGLASVLWWAALGQDEPSVALGVLAGVATLEAVATWVLAFALPNFHRVETAERAGVWRSRSGCPDDLRITYAGRALPVDAQGRLLPADERWLLGQWVTTGAAATIGVGERVQPIAPSIEQRCLWAGALGLPEATALCGRPSPAPSVAAPRSVAQPSLGVPPLQVTIDLGVTLP